MHPGGLSGELRTVFERQDRFWSDFGTLFGALWDAGSRNIGLEMLSNFARRFESLFDINKFDSGIYLVEILDKDNIVHSHKISKTK